MMGIRAVEYFGLELLNVLLQQPNLLDESWFSIGPVAEDGLSGITRDNVSLLHAMKHVRNTVRAAGT
jgi:hypothetical protein